MILKYFNKMPKKGDKIDIKGYVFIASKVTDTFIEEVILVLNNK